MQSASLASDNLCNIHVVYVINKQQRNQLSWCLGPPSRPKLAIAFRLTTVGDVTLLMSCTARFGGCYKGLTRSQLGHVSPPCYRMAIAGEVFCLAAREVRILTICLADVVSALSSCCLSLDTSNSALRCSLFSGH